MSKVGNGHTQHHFWPVRVGNWVGKAGNGLYSGIYWAHLGPKPMYYLEFLRR